MSDVYIPGAWAKRYEHLPPKAKTDVNEEVNRRFRERTGVSRKIDPTKERALMIRWLRIRDDVMAQMAGKGPPDRRKTNNGLVLWLPSSITAILSYTYLLLYNYDIGSDKPKAQHLKALDAAIGPLIKGPNNVTVGVLGHASRTGGEAFDNQGLSERRAAEVDQYLRKIGGTSINFRKAGGEGSKLQVSQDPSYREIWPYLESLDEDERDRSVVIIIQSQPSDIFDALNQPDVDWNKAFNEAASSAGAMLAFQMGILVISDYAPSPGVKGVPPPWNPVTGWPSSWTTGSPDADAVMKAMGKMMIDDIEQGARNKNLTISRDDIISHYQDWLKDPKNKWVNP